MSTNTMIFSGALLIFALLIIIFLYILKKQKQENIEKEKIRAKLIKEKQKESSIQASSQYSSGNPSAKNSVSSILESSNEIKAHKKKTNVIKKKKGLNDDETSNNSRRQAIDNLKDSGVRNPTELLKHNIQKQSNKNINEDKFLILIVDDSPSSLYAAKKALISDYSIITAKDGIDALEQINSLKNKSDIIPDLIISDVDMPNLDGFGLVTRLKNDLSLTDIPVIIMTSHLEIHAKIGPDTGIRGLITKPYKVEELQEQVNYILNY